MQSIAQFKAAIANVNRCSSRELGLEEDIRLCEDAIANADSPGEAGEIQSKLDGIAELLADAKRTSAAAYRELQIASAKVRAELAANGITPPEALCHRAGIILVASESLSPEELKIARLTSLLARAAKALSEASDELERHRFDAAAYRALAAEIRNA